MSAGKASAKGMALVEALVASAVLGMGLAGAMRLGVHTLHIATDTRQRTISNSLAVDAMECLHNQRSDCEPRQEVTVQGTKFIVQSQSRPRADLRLTDFTVRVQWETASGALDNAASGLALQVALGPPNPRRSELVLYSSQDSVPTWLGVSLP